MVVQFISGRTSKFVVREVSTESERNECNKVSLLAEFVGDYMTGDSSAQV